MQIEIRSDSVIIDGYVNAVGRDSRPIRCQTGNFVEQVEPGAFGRALKRAKNVKLLLNHRNDRELGSLAQGNLTLAEDNIGLRAHAEVTDEEVIRKARSNRLSGWSFGMYVNECEMEERSNDIPRRRLKDIDVFEVSIIDNTLRPCYAGTSVECRAEGESSLLETRTADDEVRIKNSVTAEYFAEYEKRLDFYKAQTQWLEAEKRLAELRYNENHDPKSGRFTTGGKNFPKGVDKSGNGGIISEERQLLERAIREGTVSTKLDKKKQGAHVKGNPEYMRRVANGEHPGYITVSKMEIQQVINKYSGSGRISAEGKHFRETIVADKVIGVFVEQYTGNEKPTNRATIHYSKTGTHLVPSKPEDKNV